MAFIQLVNGKCRTLPADKAQQLWLYLYDGAEGTAELERFARNVRRVWLNKEGAPPSYLERLAKEKREGQQELWYQKS
jgi:hypothetical protein